MLRDIRTTRIFKPDRQELEDLLPLLYDLYPSIDNGVIKTRLYNVAQTDWDCFALKKDQDILAMSGFRIMERICYGKFMYIDHFIVHKDHRGTNITLDLLNHLVKFAIVDGCDSIILDTFVSNSRAQKLWLNNKFKIVGFHFQRILKS